MVKTLDDDLDPIGLRGYAPAFRRHGLTSLELLKGLDGPAGADTRGKIRSRIQDGTPRPSAGAGDTGAPPAAPRRWLRLGGSLARVACADFEGVDSTASTVWAAS